MLPLLLVLPAFNIDRWKPTPHTIVSSTEATGPCMPLLVCFHYVYTSKSPHRIWVGLITMSFQGKGNLKGSNLNQGQGIYLLIAVPI